MNIIAQIFGITAIASSLIIYQQKTRKKILFFKLIQDICWFSHYLILSCYSAAATSFICISRSVVYSNNNKKFFRSPLWLPVYICLYGISAFLTWSSIFSIFPAASSILSSIAFWVKNPRITKTIAIFASLCTLVYNITVSHSVSVYIGVTFTISSALISIIESLIKDRKLGRGEKL